MEMLSRASLTLSEVEMAVILLVLSLFLLFSHSVDFAYIRGVTFHCSVSDLLRLVIQFMFTFFHFWHSAGVPRIC